MGGIYKLASCALVLAGIIFMILSLAKFRGNIKLMKEFYISDDLNRPRSLATHQFLIFLFLLGYILVLIFFTFNINFASELITGAIFFFGALFVYIENNLHQKIVASIKKNYDKTLQITNALEEEREKLLSLNRQLTPKQA
jgi:hypothetical protein